MPFQIVIEQPTSLVTVQLPLRLKNNAKEKVKSHITIFVLCVDEKSMKKNGAIK